jgi:uncharacterized protein YaeQ
LDDPDDAALSLRLNGNYEHWIDIGVPGADRMHKASKAAKRLTVVCHKSADGLIRERERRAIHKAHQIVVWLLEPSFVAALAEQLGRNTQWVVVKTGDEIMVTRDATTLTGNLTETTLAAL